MNNSLAFKDTNVLHIWYNCYNKEKLNINDIFFCWKVKSFFRTGRRYHVISFNTYFRLGYVRVKDRVPHN